MSAHDSVRLTLVPKDLWEQVQRDEALGKNDKVRMETLTFDFDLAPCRPEACSAQLEAGHELLADLKGGGGFTVHVTAESGAVLASSSIALAGFANALDEEPDNWRELLRARKAYSAE
jgi:hypothetical protein